MSTGRPPTDEYLLLLAKSAETHNTVSAEALTASTSSKDIIRKVKEDSSSDHGSLSTDPGFSLRQPRLVPRVSLLSECDQIPNPLGSRSRTSSDPLAAFTFEPCSSWEISTTLLMAAEEASATTLNATGNTISESETTSTSSNLIAAVDSVTHDKSVLKSDSLDSCVKFHRVSISSPSRDAKVDSETPATAVSPNASLVGASSSTTSSSSPSNTTSPLPLRNVGKRDGLEVEENEAPQEDLDGLDQDFSLESLEVDQVMRLGQRIAVPEGEESPAEEGEGA